MSQRSTDTRLLTQIIQHVTREELDADHPLCPHATVEAFERMVLQLNSGNIPSLSTKQRAWAERVWARLNLQTLANVLRVVDTPGASPAVALAASAEIDRLHLALHVEQNRVQRLRQALSEARRALAAAEEV